jgi:hypothetical protein
MLIYPFLGVIFSGETEILALLVFYLPPFTELLMCYSIKMTVTGHSEILKAAVLESC